MSCENRPVRPRWLAPDHAPQLTGRYDPFTLVGVQFDVHHPQWAGPGAGGLAMSSISPRATSSTAAIKMTTSAVGRPQNTKISAASATAEMRRTRRCAYVH